MNRFQRGAMIALTAMMAWSGGAQGQVSSENKAGGKGAVWLEPRVQVRIYADQHGTPIIVEAVRGIERALPARGPRFTITTAPTRDCGAVARETFAQPTITICQNYDYRWDGETNARARHHVIQNRRATVELNFWGGLDDDDDRNTACHEMMHAVSWVRDNPKAKRKSCVQGSMTKPGRWDVQYLERVYQRHDTKAKRDKHRRRGHHGRR